MFWELVLRNSGNTLPQLLTRQNVKRPKESGSLACQKLQALDFYLPDSLPGLGLQQLARWAAKKLVTFPPQNIPTLTKQQSSVEWCSCLKLQALAYCRYWLTGRNSRMWDDCQVGRTFPRVIGLVLGMVYCLLL